MIIYIALGALVATILGGLLALRFKDHLHLILGFSAGAVVAVALFDLLPEAIELTEGVYTVDLVASLIALGFVFFMIIDRFFSLHSHADECHNEHHGHSHAGKLGAGSLSLHSFLDGLAIGLSFQVSAAVGIVVAVGVLAHDFSDGINTVNMILKNGGSRFSAFRWLVLDAVAPVIGMIVGTVFVVPQATLGLLLAVFCGFFLYIGASDLVPESHHAHPTLWTTVMTVLGFAVLYAAIYFVHI